MSGRRKGIVVTAPAGAQLALLGAGGSKGAWALQTLLNEDKVAAAADAFGLGVSMFWERLEKGPILVALDDGGRVAAALVRPYDQKRLAMIRRFHRVDKRGAIEPPDDLSPWFDDNGQVDVFNTEVLSVADLTAHWRPT